MALCNALNAGLTKSCDNNAGGLVKIYIADFEKLSGYTEANSIVTGITASDFYEFEFNRGTSSYAEALSVNLQNGASFFTQTVSLVLARREKLKTEAIKKLTAGQKDLAIIVKDSNDLYWLFGREEGMVVTAIEGGSGVAKGDMNGYTITMTGEESVQAIEVDSSLIAGILA